MPLATALVPTLPADYLKVQFELAYPGLAIDAIAEGESHRLIAYAPGLRGFQLSDILKLLIDIDRLAGLPANQVSEVEFIEMLERLNAVQAPYLLRYILQTKAGLADDRFDAYRCSLQGPGMRMVAGHSQMHRYRAIEPQLLGGATLVDIGCGKAYYLRRLAGRYHQAWGYEADPEVRKQGQMALKSHGVKGVKIHGAFSCDKWIPDGAHVLLTEVLEHIPMGEAQAWLQHLSQQPAARLVLTVPNRDFNRHYGITYGMRHPGHCWEPTLAEFQEFVTRYLGEDWDIRVTGIGDTVDGVQASTLCVANREPAWLSSVLRGAVGNSVKG